MKYCPRIIYLILILVLFLNYLTLNYKKSTMEIVNEMGIGYNLGKTFNCCDISITEQNINNQIILFGTILPTKKTIKKIKKYGFKTIRFQVTYMNFTLENQLINSEWIEGIKNVIDNIIKSNLYCILSINHGNEFWKNEEKDIKDNYSNFWKQIANEFKKYDEYLIFETMNEIEKFKINILNFTQAFVDVIRKSGGFNKERLLIIPEMFTELELDTYYEYKLPIDPANKTAISVHYIFPSQIASYYDINKFEWYYKYHLFYYDSSPILEWGSEENYNQIIVFFELLKKYFIDNGIPVIIGEAGIINNYNKNISSFREFIYVFFTLSSEYDGILSCLWDNPIDNEDNLNYYNKILDKWNDEIIKDNIYIISRGKTVKSSGYYIMINYHNILPEYGYIYLEIDKKKINKIYINAKVTGKIGIDFNLVINTYNKDNNYIMLYVEKKDGKKQYDGTTIFEVDTSKVDFNVFIYITSVRGAENVHINNATFEYEEHYKYFNCKNYKKDVLYDLYDLLE